MLNLIVMMGRLTTVPEERQLSASGRKLARFTLAVDRSYTKPGEERQVDFFDVVVWEKLADIALKHCTKGQLIAVKGRMETKTYNDHYNVRRKAYTIIAENIYFAEPKRDEQNTEQPAEYAEMPDADNDLPF